MIGSIVTIDAAARIDVGVMELVEFFIDKRDHRIKVIDQCFNVEFSHCQSFPGFILRK